MLSVSNEEKSQTNNDDIDPRVGFAYSKEGKLNSSQVYILGKTTRLFGSNCIVIYHLEKQKKQKTTKMNTHAKKEKKQQISTKKAKQRQNISTKNLLNLIPIH